MTFQKGNTYGSLSSGRFQVKHGHGMRKGRGGNATPTYRSWNSMGQRTNNPNHVHYDDYGGRGIKACERWRGEHGFENFLADMGERPEGTMLDRIDNDGDYEPGNCRWATPQEQRANRRDSVRHVQMEREG